VRVFVSAFSLRRNDNVLERLKAIVNNNGLTEPLSCNFVSSVFNGAHMLSAHKVPVNSKVQHLEDIKIPVSPGNNTEDGRSLEEQLLILRARNKVLTKALEAAHTTATDKHKKNFDLVWYARNKCRYPSHEARKRIETSDDHREDLDKLKTQEADCHHGFHSGVLAAARMFKEQSDVLHVNEHDVSNQKRLHTAVLHLPHPVIC